MQPKRIPVPTIGESWIAEATDKIKRRYGLPPYATPQRGIRLVRKAYEGATPCK